MKRFATLFLTPILGVIIILIKLPEVDKWIREKYTSAPLIILVILVSATLLTHIITVISPFKKYEKIEKNKWVLIDNITNDFLGQQLFPGNHLVANVMIPKRVFYSNIVPCEKTDFKSKLKCFFGSFFVNMLQPIWISDNHTLDKRFKITTKQGVSGLAYSLGKVAIVDITRGKDDLKFNDLQKLAISGNGFVISYPIFAFDQNYNRLSTRIIGVVTLSCSTFGSEKLIYEVVTKEILIDKIVTFSRICSLIL